MNDHQRRLLGDKLNDIAMRFIATENLSHQFDILTQCCIYCRATLEKAVANNLQCSRIMEPVSDE